MIMKDNVTKTAETVNETARDIWLAGLGVFSRAQNESTKMFDGLVKEGEAFEKKARKDVDSRVVNLRESLESRFKGARGKTTSQIHKLENVFEERVANVLARLGIPTSNDIQKLSKRVELLSKEVKALNVKGTTKAA
jgi:poly(hydroxyalkanoate) granule-associated protein